MGLFGGKPGAAGAIIRNPDRTPAEKQPSVAWSRHPEPVPNAPEDGLRDGYSCACGFRVTSSGTVPGAAAAANTIARATSPAGILSSLRAA